MTEENSNNQSWWSTVPGTITAIAGLVTAIGGLIAILHSSGCFTEKNTQTNVVDSTTNKKLEPVQTTDSASKAIPSLPTTQNEQPIHTQPTIIKQLLEEHNDTRYEFIENGDYEFNLINIKNGNVSEYTVCIEGTCTNISNRCNKNFDIKNWIVNVSRGCSITVWRKEGENAGGETKIIKGTNIKKNILVWQSDGGFKLEIGVKKIK